MDHKCYINEAILIHIKWQFGLSWWSESWWLQGSKGSREGEARVAGLGVATWKPEPQLDGSETY
jgi:hypothetical protein